MIFFKICQIQRVGTASFPLEILLQALKVNPGLWQSTEAPILPHWWLVASVSDEELRICEQWHTSLWMVKKRKNNGWFCASHPLFFFFDFKNMSGKGTITISGGQNSLIQKLLKSRHSEYIMKYAPKCNFTILKNIYKMYSTFIKCIPHLSIRHIDLVQTSNTLSPCFPFVFWHTLGGSLQGGT